MRSILTAAVALVMLVPGAALADSDCVALSEEEIDAIACALDDGHQNGEGWTADYVLLLYAVLVNDVEVDSFALRGGTDVYAAQVDRMFLNDYRHAWTGIGAVVSQDASLDGSSLSSSAGAAFNQHDMAATGPGAYSEHVLTGFTVAAGIDAANVPILRKNDVSIHYEQRADNDESCVERVFLVTEVQDSPPVVTTIVPWQPCAYALPIIPQLPDLDGPGN